MCVMRVLKVSVHVHGPLVVPCLVNLARWALCIMEQVQGP